MTEFFQTVLNFFQMILQVDVLINTLALQMGVWLYALIFFVIFAETGLVFMPFLPGDSLLFAVGALSAASPSFDIRIYIPLLISASIIGDSANYFVGRKYGRSLFEKKHFLSGLFNIKYLQQTEEFYIRRGQMAVVIARFLPIVRTLAPFVGGLTKMPYRKFLFLSAGGSVLWVSTFCLAGYFFGQIPIIRENFTLLVMGIVALSVVPLIVGFFKQCLNKKST